MHPASPSISPGAASPQTTHPKITCIMPRSGNPGCAGHSWDQSRGNSPLFGRYFVRWYVQKPIPNAASPMKAAPRVQAGDTLCLRRDRHPTAIAPAPKAIARMGTRIMMMTLFGGRVRTRTGPRGGGTNVS